MEAGSVFQELPVVVLNFEFKANINRHTAEQEMPFFEQERLIMSEATSSLDEPTCRTVVETMQRMGRADGSGNGLAGRRDRGGHGS